ncbi:MAG: hypothetical protein WB611_28325, partial [Stellaceae bacterium]
MIASDWRAVEKATLRGFFTLALPSGLIIKDCSVHEKNGRRWVGFPARVQVDIEGRVRRDPATGKVLYAQVIDIAGREQRDRFQVAALTAIDEMLGKGSG